MWNIFTSPKCARSCKGHDVYEHRMGRRFDPGAMAEAFIPTLANPVYIVTRGPGRLAGAFHVLQPPQVWFGPRVGRIGIGGIQAGQIVGQRLIDPEQLIPEGVE